MNTIPLKIAMFQAHLVNASYTEVRSLRAVVMVYKRIGVYAVNRCSVSVNTKNKRFLEQ